MCDINILYEKLHDKFGKDWLVADFCKAIREEIQTIIDNLDCGAKVAIRAGGRHTLFLLKEINFDHVNIVGIYDKNEVGTHISGCNVYPTENLTPEMCDVVIISSYIFHEEIEEELRSKNIPFINIYKTLKENGLDLKAQFYEYTQEHHETLNYFYLKFLENKTRKSFEEALKACIELKDFVSFFSIYNEGQEFVNKEDKISKLKDDVENFLEQVKMLVAQRKQKDVLVYWTDAIPCKKLNLLPLTEKCSRNGVWFENAYSHTPYTHSTLNAMVSGWLPIDNFFESEEIKNEENSSLISYLVSVGYEFTYVGIENMKIDERFSICDQDFNACNIRWYNAIRRMLLTEKPVCIICHFVVETHPPIRTPLLKKMVKDIYQTQDEYQIRSSYQYMDTCLTLYREILGKKIQIFMSDHGDHFCRQESYWMDNKIHAYCFINGEGIPRKSVSKYFTYSKFANLIKWIIEPEKYCLEDALSDEVLIQDTDIYSPNLINILVESGVPKKTFAYRGILTRDGKYVINGLGEEFFYFENDVPCLYDEIKFKDMKARCGDYFLDVYAIDKFVHIRKMYEKYKK